MRQVSKAFGAQKVVDAIDLDIGSGEFVVLLGPSGCGKTTLLRLIAGLESTDSGTIALGKRDVTSLPPRERDLGMVFQSYALYPHLSVRENLAFPLHLRKTPPAEADSRIAEVARMLELGPLLERKPKALSGGQRQRVAIGRALVRRPSVCLLDEPLSNLDTSLRVHMRGELARLHQSLKMTMIYVTHDQVEAMTLATRVALLGEGRVQQFDAPLELYRRPKNRFVAGFLGSPSMNFVTARREGDSWVGHGFRLPSPAGCDVAGEALLGLRPQALRVQKEGPFEGRVDAIERLGPDGFAFLQTEAGPLTARFDGNVDVRMGESVRVGEAEDCLHIFTADGTRALRHP